MSQRSFWMEPIGAPRTIFTTPFLKLSELPIGMDVILMLSRDIALVNSPATLMCFFASEKMALFASSAFSVVKKFPQSIPTKNQPAEGEKSKEGAAKRFLPSITTSRCRRTSRYCREAYCGGENGRYADRRA